MKQVKKLCCIVSLLLTTLPLAAQGSHWGSVNPHDYQYDMTLYATITIDGVAQTDLNGADIAAFVGDELRGVGRVESKDGKSWIYMRVYSNSPSGETVTFRAYNGVNEQHVATTVAFQSMGQQGMPSTPFTLDVLNPYTLTIIIDGNVETSKTLYMGDAISLGTHKRRGYTFEWTTPTPVTMPAADLTIEGRFTINQYTVTFIVDDVILQQVKQDFNTAITPPADPSKEGYDFTGWTPEVDARVPDHDVTYTATWVESFAREDVNHDGTIDTQDVLGVYDFMQNAECDLNRFDVNADGTVDTQDVLKIYETMQNL